MMVKAFKYFLVCLSLLLFVVVGLGMTCAVSFAATDFGTSSDRYQRYDRTQSQATQSSLTLSQRVKRLENQSQSRSNLSTKLEQDQEEIRVLRGQLETQANEIKVLKDQLRLFYKDMDTRLSQGAGQANQQQAMNNTSQPTSSGKKTSSNKKPKYTMEINAMTPPPKQMHVSAKKEPITTTTMSTQQTMMPSQSTAKNEQGSDWLRYQVAHELIKTKQYDRAFSEMQSFIKEYPDSRYLPNGHYWLGELFLLRGQTVQAEAEFETIVKNYPLSNKVPDAHLKLGIIYADRGNVPRAREEFTLIQKQFPKTTSARLAAGRLRILSNR